MMLAVFPPRDSSYRNRNKLLLAESEKGEVLAAFAAHKKEVTAGSMQK
jgi:hypothetical protein